MANNETPTKGIKMQIKKPVAKTGLDEAIDEAIRELKGHDASSPEYQRIVDQLTKLHAMQDSKKSDRLSKDTLAMVLGNLAGVFVIVGYERMHVVTTKALPFLRAAR